MEMTEIDYIASQLMEPITNGEVGMPELVAESAFRDLVAYLHLACDYGEDELTLAVSRVVEGLEPFGGKGSLQ